MHRPEAISSSLQMYLKTILQLQTENQVARVKEIAERLGVTGATVSSTLRTLEERGWVRHERYGYATLTDEGKHLASCVLKRFEVVHQFLVDVLRIDPQTADADACLIEHDISPATLERLSLFIEFIQSDDPTVSAIVHNFQQFLNTRPSSLHTPQSSICQECSGDGVCKLSGTAH